MKAILLKEVGGVENLFEAEVDKPLIQTSEVLVEIKSVSINPIDTKARLGRSLVETVKAELPAILGWDISGVIQEVGEGVSELKAGDEVFGMIAFPKLGRAYAEYVAANPAELAVKPSNVSHDEAAAATLAALTAWQAIAIHGNIKAGSRVLIHAASGGVGHYAVQMAKYLGAYVIATSSIDNKDFVMSCGADEHIDYKAQPFETVTKDIDFVLDSMGGEYIDRSLTVMKQGATIVSLPSSMNQGVSEKAEADGKKGVRMLVHASGSDMRTIADLLARGIVRSHVSQRFQLSQMSEAHRQIESGRTVGKITLSF